METKSVTDKVLFEKLARVERINLIMRLWNMGYLTAEQARSLIEEEAFEPRGKKPTADHAASSPLVERT